ncbi:MAG: dephospho-CoA kinase [Bacteroidota bacterium]
MIQVGLTGGIGSGKTLVCSVLEKFGVAVYYADEEARRLMNTDPGLMRQIEELFGQEAYRNGTLDRGLLAGRVFDDSPMLAKLNALVHPAVREHYSNWVELQADVPYVVEEAAILFESGSDRYMDMNVLIWADKEERIQRVMQRDGVSRDQVEKRMHMQISEEEKKRRADIVIYNDGREMLLPQIIKLHNTILKRR